MKRSALQRWIPFRLALLVAPLIAAWPQKSLAADIWWDNTGGTANDWGSVANWSTVVAGGTNPAALPGAADLVKFSATPIIGAAQTVNLGAANRSVLGLDFLSTVTAATTIQAGGTNRILTIAGSGIVKAGTGAVTIGSATAGQQVSIALGADQTWANNNNTGILSILNGVSSNAAGPRILTLGGSSTAANVVSGAISNGSGTVSINKTGTGLWVLGSANSYTGTTTVSDGTLRIQNNTALGTGTGNILVTNSGSPTAADNNNLQVSGGITVNRNLVLENLGGGFARVTLESVNSVNVNANTWSGNITFKGGSSQALNANNAPLNITGNLLQDASPTSSIFIRGANNGTISGNISLGSASLLKTDGGSWTISSTGNTHGPVTIANGALIINNNNALQSNVSPVFGETNTNTGRLTINGGFTQSITGLSVAAASTSTTGHTVDGAGAIDVGAANRIFAVPSIPAANDLTISAAVAGSGGFTKTGTGTLFLNGSSVAGPISSSEGVLRGAFTAGGLTIGGGGVLTPGDIGSAGTINTSTLSLTNSALNFTIGTGGDAINVTTPGGFSSAGTNTINFDGNGTPLAVGVYPIVNYGSGGIGGSGLGAFTIGTKPHITGSLINSGGALALDVTAIDTVVWSGTNFTVGSPAPWDNNTTPNWILASDSSVTNYFQGDQVLFNDTATGTTAVGFTGTITPAKTTFDNSILTYTLASGTISGPGAIEKNGTGTVFVNGATLGLTGSTTINNGVLAFGNGTAAPGTMNANAPVVIGASGKLRLQGDAATARTITTGAITGSGTIEWVDGGTAGNSNLTLTASNLTGFTGTLLATGGRVAVSGGLNAPTNAAATITVPGGSGQFWHNGANTTYNSTFNIQGFGWKESSRLGALRLSGAGNVIAGTVNLTGDARINVADAANAFTISGPITGGAGSDLEVNKQNGVGSNGTLVYTGTTSMEGDVYIPGGVLRVGAGGTVGDISSVGAIRFAPLDTTDLALAAQTGTLEFQRSDAVVFTKPIYNPVQTTQVTGALTHSGLGTVTLTNPDLQLRGQISVSGASDTARLILNPGGSFNTFGPSASTGAIAPMTANIVLTNNADIEINTSSNIELAGQLNNAASSYLYHTGTGQITLSGAADNVAGKVVVSGGGMLNLGKASSASVHAIGSNNEIGLDLVNGTAKITAGGLDQIYANSDVRLSASGTLDLNGFNEGFDILTGAAGSVTNTSTTPVTLTLGQGNSGGAAGYTNDFGGIISDGAAPGGMALTKAGTGVQVLSGLNSYTGLTTVSNGTLSITGSLASGSAVSVAAAGANLAGTGTVGGTVTLNNATATISPGAGTGVGTMGTLTLGSLTQTTGDIRLDLGSVGNSATDDVLAITGNYAYAAGNLALAFGSAPDTVNAYDLVTYGGSLTGSPAVTINGQTLAAFNAGSRYQGTANYGSGTADKITLSFTGGAGSLFWNGSSGNWDVNTTSSWNLGSPGGTADKYLQFDNVTFEDTAAPGTTLTATIPTGVTVTPSSITFDNSSRTYIVAGAGTGGIGGATGVTKTGTGTATLGGSNSFTGAVTVNDGILKAGTATALGNTSGITVNSGGQFDFNGFAQTGKAYSFTIAGTGPAGAGALVNAAATNIGNNAGIRNLTLTANATVSAGNTGAAYTEGNRFDVGNAGGTVGTINGNGFTLTKEGGGMVNFRAPASNISYVVNAGTVRAEHNDALGTTGVTVNSGGLLQAWSGSTIATPLTFNVGSFFNSANAANTWTGPLTINGVNISTAQPVILSGSTSGSGTVLKSNTGNLILTGSAAAMANNIQFTDVTTGAASANAGKVHYYHPTGFAMGGNITQTAAVTGSNVVFNVGGTGADLSGRTIDIDDAATGGYLGVGNNEANFNVPQSKIVIGTGSTIAANNFHIGEQANFGGTVDQTGGAVTVNAGNLRVAHWGTETSYYNLSGGTIDFVTATPGTTPYSAGVAEQNGGIYVGIDGTGVFNQTGGTVSTNWVVLDNRGNTGVGVNMVDGIDRYNLDGGTLNFKAATGLIAVNASTEFKLGGGTLRNSGSGINVTLNSPINVTNSASVIDTNGATNQFTLIRDMSGTGGSFNLQGGGTFNVGNGVSAGGIGNLNVVTSGGTTVNFNRADSVTYAGSISGNGNLTKSAGGSLTIGANQTYTGATNLNSGTLVLGANLTNTSGLTAASGTTLSGSGTVNSGITLNAASITPGGTGLGTITSGGLAIGAGTSTYGVNLAGASTSDLINLGGGALNITGTLNVLPTAPSGGWVTGTYDIITYGSITGAPTLAPGISAGHNILGLNVLANKTQLTVVQDALVWSGTPTNATWDTTVTNTNWKLSSNPAGPNVEFINGDAVVVNDTSDNLTPINLSGTVLPSSLKVENTIAKAFTIAGAGSIGGSGSVIKNNDGLLNLGGSNTFSGGLIINGGTVKATTPQALGTGPISVASGGQLDLGGQAAGSTGSRDLSVTIAGTGPAGAAQAGALVNSDTTVSLAQNAGIRNLTLAGNATIHNNIGTGDNGRFDIGLTPAGTGNITGNGFALTKEGTGLVTVRAPATNISYVINGGVIRVEHNSALGATMATVNTGATLQAWAGFTIATPLTLNSGSFWNTGSGSTTWTGAAAMNGVNVNTASGTTLVYTGTATGTGLLKSNTGTLSLQGNGVSSMQPLTFTTVTGGTASANAGNLILVNPTGLALGSDISSAAGVTNAVVSVNVGGSGLDLTGRSVSLGDGTVARGGVFEVTGLAGTQQNGISSAAVKIGTGSNVTVDYMSLGDYGGATAAVTQDAGSVTIRNGELRIGHWPSTATYTMNGGTLDFTAAAPGVAPNGGGEQTGGIYLGVDGTGVFNQAGGTVTTNYVVLDNRVDTAGTDQYNLSGGILNLKSTYGIVRQNASAEFNFSGGTIRNSGTALTSAINTPVNLTGTGAIVDVPDAASVFNASQIWSGSGALTKTGSGTLSFSVGNSFAGGLTVNEGTVKLSGQNNGLSTAGSGTLTINSGATVEANSHNTLGQGTGAALSPLVINQGTFLAHEYNHINSITMTAGSLGVRSGVTQVDGMDLRSRNSILPTVTTLASSNTAVISSKLTLADNTTFTVANGAAAEDLEITGVITGAGSLTKEGSGTMVLTAVSNYTGPTAVNAGTLFLDSTASIASSALTVNSGGTLAGTGTTGALAVSSGGTLSPGASPGILTTGSVTTSAGSFTNIEIGGLTAGTEFDRLSTTGSVSLGGTLVVSFSFSGAQAGDFFDVWLNDGSDAITGTFTGLPEGASIPAGMGSLTISYAANADGGAVGNDVRLTYIPEPSAALLAGAAALLAAGRRRRVA